jgi:hypothetical protein
MWGCAQERSRVANDKKPSCNKMVPTSRGGLGLRPGPALWGRACPAYQLASALSPVHFTSIRKSSFARVASPKSHDEAEDGTIFQGGGSGERSGTDLAGPALPLGLETGAPPVGCRQNRPSTPSQACDVPIVRLRPFTPAKSP